MPSWYDNDVLAQVPELRIAARIERARHDARDSEVGLLWGAPTMTAHRRSAPEICPVCGEDVPPRALACPGCGADHETGWDEETTREDGLDLPGGEFDYEEFVAEEFGGRPTGARQPKVWGVALWLAAALVLAALALLALR